MELQDYCRNVNIELSGWKAKIYDIVRKLDKVSTGEKAKVVNQVHHLHIKKKTGLPYGIWRFNHKCRAITLGQQLRVEVLAPAVIHWSRDGWKTSEDIKTRETGLSLQAADLKTDELPNGAAIDFTMYWPGQNRWEDTNFHVRVGNDPL